MSVRPITAEGWASSYEKLENFPQMFEPQYGANKCFSLPSLSCFLILESEPRTFTFSHSLHPRLILKDLSH